jgi:curved DNA-binding protein CbpA
MLSPKPAKNSEPSASGTLAKKPFAHLLIYALDRKLTGTFELADERGATAYVVVAGGQVARVETSDPVTYLGHVLYELGAIDDTALSTSLAEVAATKKLHGQVLLERHAIEPEQLADALRQQRARKLQHVFTFPPKTTFAFYADVDFAGVRPGDVEPMDPLPAIWRGVREHPSWDHVRATIAGIAARPLRLIPNVDLDKFGLQDNERAAAECLRMKAQTVPELAIVGGLTIQATDLLAYFLIITKQAEVVHGATASQPPRPPSGSMKPVTNPAFASGEYARKISFSMRAVTPGEGTMRIPSPLPDRFPSPMPGRLSPIPPHDAVPLPARVASSIPARNTSSAPPRSGPPGTMPPASDLARKKSILDRAKWIDQEDYFKMLMIPRDVDTEDVRAAFLRAAKVWHPDSLPLSIIEVRAECERVFARITVAYETLVDPAKRKAYEKTINTRLRESAEADHMMSEAEMHLTLGDRETAESLARKAVVSAPTMGEARALLAHIESLDPRRGKEEHVRSCVKTIDMALGQDPMCRRAHYYRALLQKRLGEHEGAIRDLRVAVTNDSDDVDAQRELRVYEQKLREGTIQIRSMSPFPGRKADGFFDRLRKK